MCSDGANVASHVQQSLFETDCSLVFSVPPDIHAHELESEEPANRNDNSNGSSSPVLSLPLSPPDDQKQFNSAAPANLSESAALNHRPVSVSLSPTAAPLAPVSPTFVDSQATLSLTYTQNVPANITRQNVPNFIAQRMLSEHLNQQGFF